MNIEFFRLINNLANKNAFLDKIMIFFSKDVPYIFMAVTALVFIIGVIKKNEEFRKVSMSTFIITVINLMLSFIIGSVYYVDRPFVHNKVNFLVPHVKDASFPSDHAVGTMSIALGLGKYNRILGIIMTILSIIVGFSRVYVGNHYPLDVISAYAMVFITSYLYKLVLKNRVEGLYTKLEKLLISKVGFYKTEDENILN
ncbi:phosphatase PAP2 family protein [Clostridium scatologenes]|uniref:Phosphoesterase PA-phosphatase related n=1 Tax=Clostridium scatologenes TaxID=1548 RepID=A0A0E3GQ10_CLOSL|nr:phosphatase PAP2 family protein [Clostridium scatologenes]AKA67756.1 phosphoesterase PA-phosphatase related [Clostridium scatologenes]